MSTAHEHYLDAERHLNYAADATGKPDDERYHLAAAQVHATLALAASQGAANPPARYPVSPTVLVRQGELVTEQMGEQPDTAPCPCMSDGGRECVENLGHTGNHVDEDGVEFGV